MMINWLSDLKRTFLVMCGRGEGLTCEKNLSNYAHRLAASFNLLYQSSFPHSY